MPVRIETGAEPIPGYRLLNRIGGGGFGEVWRAEAPGGLLKAIKFVYGDLQISGDADSNRAQQELKALARVRKVRHPFILSLERFDIVDGQLIIVMELADRNLWDRFRECRSKGLPGIPRSELLGYMEEAAEALDLMNIQYDLQHLDIKPQNLFLIHNHVKVADFGLVKDLQGLAASVTGGVTPVYAAPETFDGWVSRYSDQYSLAIVYQELLTGVRPFRANTTQQLIQLHLTGKPDLSPLPPGDRPVIARALAKTPHERHPSCLEMVQALRQAGGESRRVLLPGFVENLGDTSQAEYTASAEEHQRTNPAAPLPEQEAVPADASRTHAVGIATQAMERRSERLGKGVIVPALVVGVGGWGLAVLRQLTRRLADRFGSVRELPHLRLLHLDTDSESQRGWGEEFLLHGGESLLMRLQRPARYLRPKDNLPDITEWLDPQMLYRMPRSQLTGGMRALGRLAFVEHYRNVRSRLQQALEAITQPDALNQAVSRCQLEMRSDWPLVFVVAHLGGGTGSGMLLDLAYLVRQLLLEQGYLPPRVIALLGLTDPEAAQASLLPLANTYAALKELEFFQAGGRRFTARYEAKGSVIQDVSPPFTRCFLTSAADERNAGDDEADAPLNSPTQAADWLYRELFTPLGRQAELIRSLDDSPRDGIRGVANPGGLTDGANQPDQPARASTLSLFGLASLEHPRRQIVHGVATYLAGRLVRQWCESSDENAVAKLEQHWQTLTESLGITPETLQVVLEQRAAETLGQDFAQAVSRTLMELRQQHQDAAAYVCDALACWHNWLGNPDESAGSWRTFALVECWEKFLEAVLQQASEALLNWVWQFVEVPGARLPAAENALRLAMTKCDSWLQVLEAQQSEAIGNQHAAEKELEEALREWERGSRVWRLERRSEHRQLALWERLRSSLEQLALARFRRVACEQLVRMYLSLRGEVSDQVKELNFCRRRLRQLADQLDQAFQQLPRLPTKHGYLYLHGESLPQAVEHALAGLPAEIVRQLDEYFQERLHREGATLQQFCTASGDALRPLCEAIVREIENWLEANWPTCDVADLLLRRGNGEPAIRATIQRLFQLAAPSAVASLPDSGRSFTLLALPNSEAGRQLAQVVGAVLPEHTVFVAGEPQELMLYREWMGVRFEDLPHLGQEARQAYEQVCSLEHFTPHSRLDIPAFRNHTEALAP
jgi:hypothetical protein